MKIFPFILILSFSVIVVACTKDKFQSKPLLEFQEYDRTVDPGQILKFRINYFDKEGDLNGAPLIAINQTLNNFPPPPNVLVDTFNYSLPQFPAKDKAEITFELNYSRLKESSSQNDTIQFRFAVTDLAGNKSDTLVSDIIILRQP
jgi:hypothetical protein